MNGIDVEAIRRWRKSLDSPGATWSLERIGGELATALKNLDDLLSLITAESTGIAQVEDEQPPSFLDAILKWYGNLRQSAQRSLSFDDMHTLAKTLSDLRSTTQPAAAADGATTPAATLTHHQVAACMAAAQWLKKYPGSVPPMWFMVSCAPRNDDDEAQHFWRKAVISADALIAAGLVTVSDGARSNRMNEGNR